MHGRTDERSTVGATLPGDTVGPRRIDNGVTMNGTDDPLETSWNALTTHWDDDDSHRAFVALAQSLGRLPDAAARYKTLRDDPVRGALAQKGLERILKVAMLALSPPRRHTTTVRRGRDWVTGAAVAMALVTCTLLLARVTKIEALGSSWVLTIEWAVAMVVPWSKVLRRDD